MMMSAWRAWTDPALAAGVLPVAGPLMDGKTR